MKRPETVAAAEAIEQAVRQTVATIRHIEGYELFPHIWRLLAEGAPVPVDRLAAVVGWPAERVRETLRAHPVEWDDQGRLVGFGMTLRPTPHKFSFEGRSLYGWCASDALMFPVLLSKPGLIESVCPATRNLVRVMVAPDGVRSVDPREAVVSAVRPDRRVENIRTEICRLGHFFGSREAAAAWLEANPEACSTRSRRISRSTAEHSRRRWVGRRAGRRHVDAFVTRSVSMRARRPYFFRGRRSHLIGLR